ncbi:MAG: dihydroorotase [Planctomycetota bacterium]|jgi:dihydroorotase
MSDLLVKGGRLVGLEGITTADVLIRDGKVRAIGPGLPQPADTDIDVLDAAGLLVFPGLIDPQVHFREPGLVHKEDLENGSLAAIAGGVTSFMEMPNTKPATTDPERLQQKLDLAAGRAHGDHAFFLGATADNAEQLAEWEQLPGGAGVKVFMGSSTGDLLVPDDATLERVLRAGHRRVAVHAEDEERLRERYANVDPGRGVEQHPDVRDVTCALRATQRLLDLAEKTDRKVHVLHLSTAEEVDLLRERNLGDLVTAEVTPNHLFLEAPDCYQRYGSLAQMNPPVRDRRHQEALREALVEGVVTCIGSDHAPHTQEEKDKPYPGSPSGIPGVQTILPLLLTAVHAGWLRHQDIVRICCAAPATVYDIHHKGPLAPGVDGDLVLVDPNVTGTLPADWLHSRAAQSPYAGMELHGWPTTTVLRGKAVYRNHAPAVAGQGRPLVMA